MRQRSVNRKGWGARNAGNVVVAADQQPQWIGAGAFAKRAADAMAFGSIEFAPGAGTDVYDVWPFPDTVKLDRRPNDLDLK